MRRRYKVETYYGPTETVLVSVRYTKEDGTIKDNVMACSWHGKVNYKPELYMISIGKSRWTWEILKKSDCFVVNFMPAELTDSVLKCGRISGRDLGGDKFMHARLAKGEAKKINCPVCLEAVARIECKKVQEVDLEDHTLFIGEVVYVVNEKPNRKRPYEIGRDNFVFV